MTIGSDLALLAARILMASVFVFSACLKLRHDAHDREVMVQMHIPYPDQLMTLTAICELTGAAMLVLGLGAHAAAVLLALFLLTITLLFLRFWTMPAGEPRFFAQNMFFANLGLLGGLVILAICGPGAIALLPIT